MMPDRARKLAVLLLMSSALLAACGGGGSSSGKLNFSSPGSAPGALMPAPAASGSNSIAVVVDAGPVQGASQVNVPYVTVTVCTPGTSGTTAACQTIGHVVLDTGSYGLRLLNSVLYSNLVLPPAMSGSAAIGECVAFAVGTTWGSVRYADVYLGGEVARNVPIQDIGDSPGGAAAVPSDCGTASQMQDTQAQLGANGILGVGPFRNDCDPCLSASPPLAGAYYTCTSAGCTNSDVTASQVVQNPVADFAQDNNGVQVSMDPLPSAGATYSNLSGTLVFGIGTQVNNPLGSATVYAADPNGNIQTTYNGTLTPSFIDSGSNAYFFSDSGIAMCTYNIGFYCPSPSPLQLSATNTGAYNVPSPGTVTPFSIIAADTLNAGVIAANVAGSPAIQSQFDWGLPFFFGRTVFTAISGASAPVAAGTVGTGPYFAY